MSIVKRVTIGMNAKIDVDGKGDYVFGVVESNEDGVITLIPSDGSESVTCKKAVLEKATAAEVRAFNTTDDAEDEEDTTEGDEEELEGSKMSQAINKYRVGYTPAKLPSGRKTLHNNDKIAKSLVGMDLEAAKKFVAKEIGTSAAALTKKYGHLNRGHQRMLIGNLLRQYIKDAA